MKGWLADFWRAAWAFFYWNTRKSFFVLRRRRGQCPCHNPSDSGRPLATGCEAVTGWHRPERFARVCPLLRRNDAGFWVCSVPPAKVRPFWLRALRYYVAALLALWLVLAALAFAGLKGIGYQVAYRQLAWPPAWAELPAVRAELFIRQARDNYQAGRVKEAINALSVAYQLDPGNYQAGMMLAQFYRAGSPKQADELYRRLLVDHPAPRAETARAWFQSLLARGRLQDVGELARRQLTTDPEQAAAWTHALLFVTRHLPGSDLLKTARTDPDTPAPARAVFDLALRAGELSPAAARNLLVREPFVTDFPYDRVYRVETLLRLGYPQDALELLARGRAVLAGRDVARLALAAHAGLQDQARLHGEIAALLDPRRDLHPSELTLLAVHLVSYPDPQLLGAVIAALPRVMGATENPGLESALAVFCAAGVQRDAAGMQRVKQLLQDSYALNLHGTDRLERFFLGTGGAARIESVLPTLTTLSLELNYALLERYLPAN